MADNATTNIERIKKLRAFAGGLRGATERWRHDYSDRKLYDKQGFGFTVRADTSWNAFKVPTMAFEAYVGTYGNSSCGNAWSVNQDLVNAYFVKALNQHKQAIFDSMAELAEADAAGLLSAASTELEVLRTMLSEIEKVAA